MAFPVVEARATGRTTASNTTTHAITLPSGITAGELLLVVFACDGSPVISVNTGVSGNNWNALTQGANGTVVSSNVFWKIAEGGDALTLTTSAGEQSSHASFRISGGYSVTGTSANGSSTNSNPPNHAGHDGTQDYLWIATRAGDSTVNATVAPANFGNLQTLNAAGTAGASIATAERSLNAASEDPGTFTSNSEQWVSFTIAVSPVDPGGGGGGGLGSTPAFVGAGVRQNNASTTSRTPALPSTLTNGDILICVCGSANNAVHSVDGGGWQPFYPQTDSGSAFTCSFWWRVVDGTEASPTISWTGAAAAWAMVHNYSRDNYDTEAPWGAQGEASVGNGDTASADGITTTRGNSLALYIIVTNNNSAIATPSGGWTEREDTGSTTSGTRNALGDLSLPTPGTASGAISAAITSADWLAFQIELLAAQSSGGTTLTPPFLDDGDTFYPAQVVLGPVSLTPPFLDEGDTFYPAQIVLGPVTLTPPFLDEGDTFYPATIVQGAAPQTITPPFLDEGDTFYPAQIVLGPVTLTSPFLDEGDTFYPAQIVLGPVTLTPPFLDEGDTFYPATIVQEGVVLPGRASFPGASRTGGALTSSERGGRVMRGPNGGTLIRG